MRRRKCYSRHSVFPQRGQKLSQKILLNRCFDSDKENGHGGGNNNNNNDNNNNNNDDDNNNNNNNNEKK